MSSGLTETEIVEGLRNGDRNAWNALCSSYGDQLWRFVSRLVGGDENVVAEICQESLMAVAKNGRTIRADTKLWAWLSRIGHNQVALHWRKRFRNQTVRLESEPVDRNSAVPIAEALVRLENIDQVRFLLSNMSSEHATLLVSKYVDEMPVAEICDALGGSRESVRSKLARARKDFRKRYEQLTTPHGEASASSDVIPDQGNL